MSGFNLYLIYTGLLSSWGEYSSSLQKSRSMDIKDFTVFTVFHIPLSINSKYFFLKLCVSLPVTDKKIRFEIAFEQLPIDLFFQTASLNISLNCLIITTRSGSLISLIYINWHFLFIKFADRRLWIGYLHSGENWFLQFNICNRSITIIIHS